MISVSLFSGCLGLDLGLEQAGIQTAAYVENDSAAQATIRANRPGVPVFNDVRAVTGDQLRSAAGGDIDVLAGGPPCQPFSTIGQRRFMNDERGQLIRDQIRLVEETHPRFFVLEGVPGMLSATQDDRPWFPSLLNRFRLLGYSVTWVKIDAADVGSPQKRVRVVVLGSVNSIVVMAGAVNNVVESSQSVLPVRTFTAPVVQQTLGSAISDLECYPGECGRFSPKTAAIMEHVPEGGNWKSLPTAIQDEAMGRADRGSGGLTAFYRRLSYDRPSPTLLVSPTQRATTLCHPRITRPLSIAEYKRIQGLPDDWVVTGSLADKYRQIGNAVPVQLGLAIGRALNA